MQAITSFYTTCFLHASLSPGYMYIYIVCVVYICVPYVIHDVSIVSINVASAATVAASLPSLLPLLLMHANNWWWTNKMASFGFGPGNPVRRYPRVCMCVCRLFGNAIPFRHARQPIYPIHTHSFTHIHQYAGDESHRLCLSPGRGNKQELYLFTITLGRLLLHFWQTHTHI